MGNLKKELVSGVMPREKERVSRNSSGDLMSFAHRCRRTRRPAPYGYRCGLVMSDGSIVVLGKGDVTRGQSSNFRYVLDEPARTETVKRIFSLYIEEGLGYFRIAQLLNKEGIPPPDGNKKKRINMWSICAVRDILRRPVYVGMARVKRPSSIHLHHSHNCSISMTREQSTKAQESADKSVEENYHEAIIDKKTFQKAQRIMQLRAERLSSRRSYENRMPRLLHGLVFCGHCSSLMYPTIGKGEDLYTGAIRYNYKCSGYIRKGRHACQPYCIPCEQLDAVVLFNLKQHYLNLIASGSIDTVQALCKKYKGLRILFGASEINRFSHKENASETALAHQLLSGCDSLHRHKYSRRLKKMLRALIATVTLYFENIVLSGNRTVFQLAKGVVSLKSNPDECKDCTKNTFVEFHGESFYDHIL